MADIPITNDTTGDLGTNAARRTRYEKMETAFGRIPAAAYAAGDTLQFVNIPMKELIKAEFAFVDANIETKVYSGADLSTPVAVDLELSGTVSEIAYVIDYIRGAGSPTLELTVTSSIP